MCVLGKYLLYIKVCLVYMNLYIKYLYYRYFTWFQEDDNWETMDKTQFPEGYLPVINSIMAKEPCIHKSLLKIWQKDNRNIDKLTKTKILKDITATLQNK